MDKIPVENCLKCKNYDACEDFEDGSCPKARQPALNGIFISHGLIMTVEEWAKFFGLSPATVSQTISKEGTLDKLFVRRVEKELKKLAE